MKKFYKTASLTKILMKLEDLMAHHINLSQFVIRIKIILDM
jgi:hypothetical protein